MNAALIWASILFVVATIHFVAGCIFYRMARKRFQTALDLHTEVKSLLESCAVTRDKSGEFMEMGRVYWMMAQIERENDEEDWRQS